MKSKSRRTIAAQRKRTLQVGRLRHAVLSLQRELDAVTRKVDGMIAEKERALEAHKASNEEWERKRREVEQGVQEILRRYPITAGRELALCSVTA